MTNLREKPLRLECYLTRDYINQAQKMRELEAYKARWFDHPMAYVFAWVVVGVLFVYVLLNL